MKKVLIITYYWPPSGGSGVQRWLKFVKYLPGFGWEPHVFTPENPSFAVRDPSLEKDVPFEAEIIRFPIWEPYDIFLRIASLAGAKKQVTPTALVAGKKKSLFQVISTWIRGNFFIPDPRRFWIKPSVDFLSDYVVRNQIRVVITTGPPHSVHLIGLKLKDKLPELRWIADFRDPWSEWGLLDSLMVTSTARTIHRKMEQSVLARADEVTTITPFYVRRFEQLGNRKVRLLTNGFDEEDFKSMRHEASDKFIIRHVGIVNEKCDPRPFLKALDQLIQDDAGFASDVQLEFIGEVHERVTKFVHENKLLDSVTAFAGNIPHAELLRLYGSSALLLLILTGYKNAEGYLPGKLFEYLACGLPVLGIGPEQGDAAVVLAESGAGKMVESFHEDKIKKALLEVYHRWKSGGSSPVSVNYPFRYSRREITRKLAVILDELQAS